MKQTPSFRRHQPPATWTLTLTYKIAPWCGLIKVIFNWIVAEVTRLLSQPEPQSDIMVAILFSGSSPGNAQACSRLWESVLYALQFSGHFLVKMKVFHAWPLTSHLLLLSTFHMGSQSCMLCSFQGIFWSKWKFTVHDLWPLIYFCCQV